MTEPPAARAPLRPVVVLHTPKCGGTSLRRSLAEACGEDRLDPRYGDETRIRVQVTPGRPVVIGHFQARRIVPQPDVLYATLIREPVARFISTYLEWRYWPEPTVGLREAVRSGAVTLLDLAAKPRMGRAYTAHYFAGVDLGMFEVIIDAAAYRAGLDRLAEASGLPLAHHHINRSGRRAPEGARARILGDRKTMAALRGIMADDIAWYAAARKHPNVVRRPGLLAALARVVRRG